GFLVRSWRTGDVPRWLLATLAASMLLSPRDFIPWEPIWPVATSLTIATILARRYAPALARIAATVSALALSAILAGVLVMSVMGRRITDVDVSQGVLVSILAIMAVAALVLVPRLIRQRPSSQVTMAAATITVIAALGLARFESWQFQRSHAGGLRAAEEFQTWARTSTPLDSVFLTLPSEPNN